MTAVACLSDNGIFKNLKLMKIGVENDNENKTAG